MGICPDSGCPKRERAVEGEGGGSRRGRTVRGGGGGGGSGKAAPHVSQSRLFAKPSRSFLACL